VFNARRLAGEQSRCDLRAVAIEEDEARGSGGGGRIRTEAERGCEGSMGTEEEHARKRKRIGR
jgi:hypothetical protein